MRPPSRERAAVAPESGSSSSSRQRGGILRPDRHSSPALRRLIFLDSPEIRVLWTWVFSLETGGGAGTFSSTCSWFFVYIPVYGLHPPPPPHSSGDAHAAAISAHKGAFGWHLTLHQSHRSLPVICSALAIHVHLLPKKFHFLVIMSIASRKPREQTRVISRGINLALGKELTIGTSAHRRARQNLRWAEERRSKRGLRQPLSVSPGFTRSQARTTPMTIP